MKEQTDRRPRKGICRMIDEITQLMSTTTYFADKEGLQEMKKRMNRESILPDDELVHQLKCIQHLLTKEKNRKMAATCVKAIIFTLKTKYFG